MAGQITYLGDGLYASFDGYQIALRVNDFRDKPVAYLDPEVQEALVKYIGDLRKPVPKEPV